MMFSDTESSISEIEVIEEGSQYNAFNCRKNKIIVIKKTDIQFIQKELLKNYAGSFYISEPCSGNQRIDQLFDKILLSIISDKPHLLMFNQDNINWTSMATVKQGGKIFILQKHSVASKHEQPVLLPKLPEFEIDLKHNNLSEPIEDSNYGVFALRNLQIMAQKIVDNPKSFIESFSNYQGFCSAKELNQLRVEYAKYYVVGIYKNIVEENTKYDLLLAIRSNHEIEIGQICCCLKEQFNNDIAKGEVNIRLLKGEQVKEPISQTIAVELIITNFNQATKKYAYSYKVSWTIDLEWGGKVDAMKLEKQLEENKMIYSIKQGDSKFITLIPKECTDQYKGQITERKPTMDKIKDALVANNQDESEIVKILGEFNLELSGDEII